MKYFVVGMLALMTTTGFAIPLASGELRGTQKCDTCIQNVAKNQPSSLTSDSKASPEELLVQSQRKCNKENQCTKMI